MRPVVQEVAVDLASSIEQIWPLISDTNRINAAIGLPPMQFRPVEAESKSGARFVGRTSVLGMTTDFDEYPFEWSYGKDIRVLRQMRKGSLASVVISGEVQVLPAPPGEGKGDRTGCRLTLRCELLPRSAAIRPLLWLLGKRLISKLAGLARKFDEVVAGAPSPTSTQSSVANAAIVNAAIVQLKKMGVEAGLADRLGAFVQGASDFDLIRVRPFDLATDWGVDGHAVLSALLHGVPGGLFELKWAIVCPSCRIASEEANSLDQISLEGHCQLCDISFEVDLDRAVEATFSPHPSARAVRRQMFCSGGPARTPHVVTQILLQPEERRDVRVPEEPGRYRFFARGGAAASVEVKAGGLASAEVKVEESAIRPADLALAPGSVVSVSNQTSEPRHVKLERLVYGTAAATAHVVSTMPEFRSFFSGDLLKPSTPLKVSRAAILFSDLTGSTALYSKVGDAAAFRLVDDHFDLMRSIVKEENGSLVKTMGDAVMASFVDAGACLRASLAALHRFESFRLGRAHGEYVGIKLGINAGACYVVTANGALDYFGQTVNVASRLQHLASSGELVLPRDLFDALPRADQDRAIAGETFEATVKGVEHPLRLVRLKPAP